MRHAVPEVEPVHLYWFIPQLDRAGDSGHLTPERARLVDIKLGGLGYVPAAPDQVCVAPPHREPAQVRVSDSAGHEATPMRRVVAALAAHRAAFAALHLVEVG